MYIYVDIFLLKNSFIYYHYIEMTSKKMEKLFHILDLNKDNKLSVDELKIIFQNSSELQFNLYVYLHTHFKYWHLCNICFFFNFSNIKINY